MYYVGVDPRLDPIRDDPRYAGLIARMRIPIAAGASRRAD
jgi:hypothetical protein